MPIRKPFTLMNTYRDAMKHLTRILALGLGLILPAGCNLTTQAPISVTATSIVGGKPTVLITSPQNNAEVAVGTQVLVSAVATDNVGVTRVQLAANNQIVKTVSSESPSGQRNFQVVLDYTPRETGTVTLQILAYRDAIASDPALVTIVVKTAITAPTATSGISVPGQPGGGVPQPPVIDPNDPTCRALTNTNLNLRTGPGTNYDRITVLAAGAVVPIIGRVADNSWWQVRSGSSTGWVSAQYTSVYGICTATPIVAAPPTPTGIVPTATNRPPGPPTVTNTPIPAGNPNLVVASISIGGPVSITVPLDGNVTYSAVITNRGTAAAGPFTVVGQSINTTGTPTPAFPGTGGASSIGVVNSLGAGNSITLNGMVTTVTAGQAYTIWVTVDPNNQVNEGSGESDNSLGFTFTTAP
jgi:hypothetical protein